MALEKRSWPDFVKEFSPEDIKKKSKELLKDIRDLACLHYLLGHHPYTTPIFGLSGTKTLQEEIQICIAEQMAWVHFCVEKGIRATIDEANPSAKGSLAEKERKACMMMDQACRLTVSRAHRFQELLTRSAYLPSQSEEREILSLLEVNLEKEGLCCYEKNNKEYAGYFKNPPLQ